MDRSLKPRPGTAAMAQSSRHAGRHGAGALIDAERDLAAWACSERAEDPGIVAEFASLPRRAAEEDGLDRYDPSEMEGGR